MSGTGGQRAGVDASTFVERLGIAAPWTVRAQGETSRARTSPWREPPRLEDLPVIRAQTWEFVRSFPRMKRTGTAARSNAFTQHLGNRSNHSEEARRNGRWYLHAWWRRPRTGDHANHAGRASAKRNGHGLVQAE